MMTNNTRMDNLFNIDSLSTYMLNPPKPQNPSAKSLTVRNLNYSGYLINKEVHLYT